MQVGPALGGAAPGTHRPEFVIRPGVRFPDWQCIRSANAEAALLAMFRLVRVERRWTDYSAELDKVRTEILRSFATRDHGPDLTELARATAMGRADLGSVLDELALRDLVVLDATGRVTGAYPFTEHATGHSVRRGDLAIRAMCAIDALGAGAMLGEDVEVLSSCRDCGCPIRVGTAAEGTALRSIEPATAVVWLGQTYHGNCGATSLCAGIAFFCCDGHLDRWRSSAAAGTGHRLSVDEAHQVGCAIFGPVLLGTAARPRGAPTL